MKHKDLVFSAQLLANLIDKKAKALVTQDQKREQIIELQSEMATAISHVGEEGYRDIVKIGQDLKRVNGYLDRDLEIIEDFEAQVQEQLALVQAHLDSLKDDLTEQLSEAA